MVKILKKQRKKKDFSNEDVYTVFEKYQIIV